MLKTLRFAYWLLRAGTGNPLSRLRNGLENRQALAASGLFDQDWYLAQYPEVAGLGELALEHYTAFGLAQCRNPNPLFDASWYLARNPDVAEAGINPLAHYLQQGAAEGRDPNPLFDSDWYLAEYPDVADAGINPLAHYLHAGAAEGRDPSPMFNTAWYRWEYPDAVRRGVTALGDYLGDGARQNRYPSPLFQTDLYVRSVAPALPPRQALRHFLDSGRSQAPGAYRSFSALADCQERFRARTEMCLQRDTRVAPRRFAVFLQCGSGAITTQWHCRASRTWDLVINHFEPTHRGRIPCDVEFHQTGELAGTKFTALATILRRWRRVVAPYDYVMLLDDDIEIDAADIDKTFRIADNFALALAQPSLSSDSYASYEVFRHNSAGGIRAVRGVEVMMPLLSRRAMAIAAPLFEETISGWGLDYALAELVSRVGDGSAAVLDDVVAKHRKPIDFSEGAYYRMLLSAGIYPEIEMRCMRWKYKLDWWDFARA